MYHDLLIKSIGFHENYAQHFWTSIASGPENVERPCSNKAKRARDTENYFTSPCYIDKHVPLGPYIIETLDTLLYLNQCHILE